jgi:hypothetical protein
MYQTTVPIVFVICIIYGPCIYVYTRIRGFGFRVALGQDLTHQPASAPQPPQGADILSL